MRLERLASLGAPRPRLLVAPALLIAANLGVAGLELSPAARAPDRAQVADDHELGRVSVRAQATRQPRSQVVRPTILHIEQLLVERPELAAVLRKAVNNSPPPPPPPPPPAPPPPPPPVVAAPPSLPTDSLWRSLSMCESGGNWQRDSGNGYYGGLQFSLESWASVGGAGYPHEHPADRQIELAARLHARQGWDAWPACADRLGLV